MIYAWPFAKWDQRPQVKRALKSICAVFIFSLSHILTSIRNNPVRIRAHD